MITIEQLKAIMPHSVSLKRNNFIEPINEAMREFNINTRLRICAFLAQIAHESASLNYVEEIASGSAYEGRKDLGNIHEGDGVRFKGRGLIQITGRANYLEVSKAFGMDFISNPELLESYEYAVKSAAWFWARHGLNELADIPDFLKITKVINGGKNGLASRESFYNKALEIIK